MAQRVLSLGCCPGCHSLSLGVVCVFEAARWCPVLLEHPLTRMLCLLLGLPQLAPGCGAWVDLDLLLVWSEILLSPLGVLGDSWTGLTIIKLSPPTPISLNEQVLIPVHKNRHFSHKGL